jgi:histone deacetylase 1/2
MRYLQATTSYCLHITRDSSLSLHGFTDADWASSIDDRKSTSGFLVYLGSTPISRKSEKQRSVARSSIEAKYKALTDGTAKILWIRSLLSELQLPSSSITTLWCDNLGPLSYLAIKCFMLALNMLKLTIILFVIALLSKKFRYDLSLQRTN